MTAVFTPLLASLGPWALLVLVVVVFAETGLLVGFFLPGDSLLFAAGLFVATGVIPLPLALVFAVTAVAALAGDQVGYEIGTRIGARLLQRGSSRWVSASHLASATRFFTRHGQKAVILARFVPLVRTFTPVVAGALGMSRRRFTAFNAIGAIAWTGGALLAGRVLGGVAVVAAHVELFTIGLVAVTTLPALAAFALRRRRKGRQVPVPPPPAATGAGPTDPPCSAGDARASRRAVVVTGSYGSGHDVAASRIADRLRRSGRDVDIVDVAEVFPLGLGRALRRLYLVQLKGCSRSWGWLLDVTDGDGRVGRLARRLTVWVLEALLASRLLAALGGPAELVVSTHPFAGAALAALRRRGELAVPVVTYLTDPSVHPLCVHPGVDLHVATDVRARDATVALGGATALVVPLTGTHGCAEASTTVLPITVAVSLPMALIVGGSEGVGQLVPTARDVVRAGAARPVVVCGHNHRLRARVERIPGAIALPWQDNLPDLIARADVLIQNAGGTTALEALAIGTPVVSYRCLPGHGVANAAVLEAEQLASWPRSVSSLADAITSALVQERTPPPGWRDRPSFEEALVRSGVLTAPAPAIAVGRRG